MCCFCRGEMNARPKCCDLYCGAGGAAMGLYRAGFDVTGFDIAFQKHYPFAFVQANALEVDLSGFDFVWASPPCQAHTTLKHMPNAKHHEDLIPATREKLKAWGGLYIIENVPGSTLSPITMLCGTMFDLGTKDGEAELRRHRYFESNIFLTSMLCRHFRKTVLGVYGDHGGSQKKSRSVGVYGGSGESTRNGYYQFGVKERAEAMGIDWMTNKELTQAIPPAYSEFLGKQILKHL